MSSSMLIGFNNDVEFRGRMFHIQTEDHGIKDGHITTILFFSGQILDSKKISYVDDIDGLSDDEDRKKAIKKRMVELHREFYKRLFDGLYEEKVAQLAAREGGDSGSTPAARPATGVTKLSVGPSSSPGIRPAARGPAPSSTTSAAVTATAPRRAATEVRKGPPPLRAQLGAPPSHRPANPAIAATRRGGGGDKGGQPAFRGLLWPSEDLRIDGLVAEFLESQSG